MMMRRLIPGLSFVILLVLVSQSHPTSAADDDAFMSHHLKALEKIGADHASFEPTKKLGVHIKRGGTARGGGGGGGGVRIGRTLPTGTTSTSSSSSSSSARPILHISSFHFASILGCSFFLVLFLL